MRSQACTLTTLSTTRSPSHQSRAGTASDQCSSTHSPSELAGWPDPGGRVDAVVKSVATHEGSPARTEVVIEYTWMNVPFEERYILIGEDDGWYIDQILLGDKVIVGREFVPGTVAPGGARKAPGLRRSRTSACTGARADARRWAYLMSKCRE